jgi:hypothetical protein
MIDVASQVVRLGEFVVCFCQKTCQQFVAFDFERGHSNTNVYKIVVIQSEQFQFFDC